MNKSTNEDGNNKNISNADKKYNEIETILDECSREEKYSIIYNINDKHYMDVFKCLFDSWCEDDPEVKAIIHNIYRMRVLRYILEDTGRLDADEYDKALNDTDNHISGIYDSLMRSINGTLDFEIRNNIIHDVDSDIMIHPICSAKFREGFHSKLIEILNNQYINDHDRRVFDATKSYNDDVCTKKEKERARKAMSETLRHY